MKNFYKIYCPNKNYTSIYLHVFGDKIANAMIEIFTGVFFYSLGMPLHFILLFFGLEFGLRGILAPLGPYLTSRIGFKKAILISYFALIFYFIFVSLAQVSLLLGFFAFLFQSFARGIYYPNFDTMHSLLVDRSYRGKQITMEMTLTSLSGIFAVFLGTVVLVWLNYYVITIIISFILFLSLIPLIFIEENFKSHKISFLESYKYLASKQFKENYISLSTQSMVIIGSLITAPLFIFILVGKMEIYGLIMFLAILIEATSVLVYGFLIDKNGQKNTSNLAIAVHSFSFIGLNLLLWGYINPYFANSFHRLASNLYFSNYRSRLHQKAQNSGQSILFNTASQMNLCFVEIFLLGLFAIIAWFINIWVFLIIFLLSIISLFISIKTFKD